jgi:REP element-mobilizing transposase RayT
MLRLMPRGPRLDAPGALHHVIARGIERRAIFRHDGDRTQFLDRLADVMAATRLQLLAWSLMPNHVHLLIRTRDRSLSTGMRCLLTGYAVTFNRHHRRAGHLFQNRFKSTLVEEEPYFLQLVRYIHLNPLRARLVADLPALDRFLWTGHPVLMGRVAYPVQDTLAVLAHFGPSVTVAQRAYRQFVQDALTTAPAVDVSGGGLRRSAGGWQPLPTLARGRERWSFDERILGSSAFVEQMLASAPPLPPSPAPHCDGIAVLASLCARVSVDCGIAAAELTSGSQRPVVVAARQLISHLAVAHYGLPTRTIATALRISPQSVRRGIIAGRQLLEKAQSTSTQLLSSN